MTWENQLNKTSPAPKLQFVGPSHSPWVLSAGSYILPTARRMKGRLKLAFPEGATEFRMPTIGVFLNGANLQKATDKPYTVQATVEYATPQVAPPPPFEWAGSSTKVVAAGASLELSDDWCVKNGPIPAGAHLWVRYDVSVTTDSMITTNLSYTETAGAFQSINYAYIAGSTAADAQNLVNGHGPLTNPGVLTGGQFWPIVIPGFLAKFAGGTRTCVAAFGDSNVLGLGLVAVTAGTGMVGRAYNSLGIECLNFGIASSTMVSLADVPASYFAMAAYMTDVHLGSPGNDVTAGTAIGPIQTAYNTLITKIKTINPGARIWMHKYMPHTTNNPLTTITAQSTTGYVATITVANIENIPAVGMPIQITGYSGTAPASYNGVWAVTRKDAGTGTGTFDFVYSGTGVSGGTPVLTDAFTSATYQTPYPQCGPESTSTRSVYNTWCDTLAANGTIFGALDPNVVTERGGPNSATATWADQGTTDGTHAYDMMYTAVSSEFRRQMLARGILQNTPR